MKCDTRMLQKNPPDNMVEDGMSAGLTNTRTALIVDSQCSVSRIRSKTLHSLFCITSKKLPYTTLCFIASRFIRLPCNFRARQY